MTDFISKETLETLQAYFPELNVYNSQYSGVVFDDTVNDPQNITNLDNKQATTTATNIRHPHMSCKFGMT